MNIPYIEFLFRPLRSELPHYDTLDQYLDYIIPNIAPYGEDLYEEEYYVEKPWLEVNDRDDALNAVLHILKEKTTPLEIQEKLDAQGPNYLKSIDGNVQQGHWGRLEKQGANIMMLRMGKDYQLYEKAFINNDFFILKKHGNSKPKYFLLGRQSHVKGLEWREVVELLYDIYRYRIQFIIMVLVIAVVVFIILALSFY